MTRKLMGLMMDFFDADPALNFECGLTTPKYKTRYLPARAGLKVKERGKGGPN